MSLRQSLQTLGWWKTKWSEDLAATAKLLRSWEPLRPAAAEKAGELAARKTECQEAPFPPNNLDAARRASRRFTAFRHLWLNRPVLVLRGWLLLLAILQMLKVLLLIGLTFAGGFSLSYWLGRWLSGQSWFF